MRFRLWADGLQFVRIKLWSRKFEVSVTKNFKYYNHSTTTTAFALKSPLWLLLSPVQSRRPATDTRG